jgi:hypothetical protein
LRLERPTFLMINGNNIQGQEDIDSKKANTQKVNVNRSGG